MVYGLIRMTQRYSRPMVALAPSYLANTMVSAGNACWSYVQIGIFHNVN